MDIILRPCQRAGHDIDAVGNDGRVRVDGGCLNRWSRDRGRSIGRSRFAVVDHRSFSRGPMIRSIVGDWLVKPITHAGIGRVVRYPA